MEKPSSIRMFGALYLGSLALWAANTALFWSRAQAIMAQSPQIRANPQVAAVIGPIMIGALVVTAACTLLFWFLVVRLRSVVGKWLVAATEAIGALFAAFAILKLVGGRVPATPSILIGLVVTGLAVAAAAMLFRPDAAAWFATPDGGDDAGGPVEPLP